MQENNCNIKSALKFCKLNFDLLTPSGLDAVSHKKRFLATDAILKALYSQLTVVDIFDK